MQVDTPDPALGRLLESIGAEEAPAPPKSSHGGPVTVSRALVGQINGKVIILGDVPANVLEMVLGKRT